METTIFTDGSSRGNPGRGGWGAVISERERVIELGGGEKITTNNRMELTAVIESLEFSKEKNITLYTDSSYVINGITKWVVGWMKNGWKTSTKDEVLNRDLWERLIPLASKKNILWKLLKGHSGIPGNERCDVIATSFADNKNLKLYSGSKDLYEIDLVVKEKRESLKASTSKKSKSGVAFSYVSLVDGKIYVDKTWEECKSRVNGVPKTKFKKSFSSDDEKNIIEEFKK